MAEMTKKNLVALLKKDIATKQKMNELRESWKTELNEAVGHFDVHPKALNFVRWVYRAMETRPDEVAQVLDQVDLFCDWLGVRSVAAAAAAVNSSAAEPPQEQAQEQAQAA
jgi:hypothetical protein